MKDTETNKPVSTNKTLFEIDSLTKIFTSKSLSLSNWKKVNKIKLSKIILIILLLVYVIFFYECGSKLLFDIPCPSCGFRSAVFACFRLDFRQAFDYHPLFWLLGIDLIYLVFRNHFRVSKKLEITIGIITIILLLLVWIFRVWYLPLCQI